MQEETPKKIEAEKEFSEHYFEHAAFAENFFRKRISNKDDVEEISSNAMLRLYGAMQRKMTPLEERKKILSKICRNLYADYCKKKMNIPSPVSSENLKHCLSDEGKNTETLSENNSPAASWQIRAVLLCPHRSLQEVTILNQAPSCPKLIRKIRQKFPLTAERYIKYGPYIEFIRKEEKIPKKERGAYEKEVSYFIKTIFDAAEFFKANDDIGVSALKILFLAENPWKDWYFLSQSMGKDYLHLTEKGLARKGRRKRPLPSLLRDSLLLSGLGLKEIKKIIKGLATEPRKDLTSEQRKDSVVEESYIEDYYHLKNISSSTIGKAKDRHKKKIEGYEADICRFIKDIK